MAHNLTKTWHLCPTFDILPPPAGNTLKLGDIVISKNYEDLRVPLNRFDRPYVTDSQELSPRSTFHNFKQSQSGNLNFLAKLACLFGLESSASSSAMKETQYVFDQEYDMLFEPTVEWIRDTVMASTAVQLHLQETSFRKPLYMIIGIKSVDGVSMRTSKGRTRQGAVGFEADATPTGLLLDGVMKGGVSNSTSEEHTARGGSSFIFAIRLKKITWGKMGNIKARDYLDGAFLSVRKNEEDIEDAWNISVAESGMNDFDDCDAVELIEYESGLETVLIYTV